MIKYTCAIIIAMVVLTGVTSCVKVHNCRCTYDTANGLNKEPDVTEYPVTKKVAEENCAEDDAYAKKIWGPASHCEL